jgi:hypothetical protein
MWDFLLGEFGMSARKARYLTWVELDSVMHGYAKRQQEALVGSRMVATQLYNAVEAFAKKPKFITEQKYRWLPLVDRGEAPQKAKPVKLPDEAMRKRLEARFGKPVIFEQAPVAV